MFANSLISDNGFRAKVAVTKADNYNLIDEVEVIGDGADLIISVKEIQIQTPNEYQLLLLTVRNHFIFLIQK